MAAVHWFSRYPCHHSPEFWKWVILHNSQAGSFPAVQPWDYPWAPFLSLSLNTYNMHCSCWQEGIMEQKDRHPFRKPVCVPPHTVSLLSLCTDDHHLCWSPSVSSQLPEHSCWTHNQTLGLFFSRLADSRLPPATLCRLLTGTAEAPPLVPVGSASAKPSASLRRAFFFLAYFFCEPAQFFLLKVRFLTPIKRPRSASPPHGSLIRAPEKFWLLLYGNRGRSWR
jgi:hypothetical protein